jgi:hypothetical protein
MARSRSSIQSETGLELKFMLKPSFQSESSGTIIRSNYGKKRVILVFFGIIPGILANNQWK